MKYLPHLAAAILGILFLMASTLYLFGLAPSPELPEGSPVAMFMGAMGATGYMTFVKVCELVGGILVIIPRTRNLGLLVLGPIIVNILAFNTFITGGTGLVDPMVLIPVVTSLFLLWCSRKAFLGLV